MEEVYLGTTSLWTAFEHRKLYMTGVKSQSVKVLGVEKCQNLLMFERD